MSGGDLAVIVVSVAAIACFGVMLAAVMIFARTVGELRDAIADVDAAIAELRGAALPQMGEMVGELRSTVVEAGAEIDRVDGLLGTAENISARVDSASRLGYLAFRAPLIRFVAFFEGLWRALRRLVGLDRARRQPRSAHGRVRSASGSGGPVGPGGPDGGDARDRTAA